MVFQRKFNDFKMCKMRFFLRGRGGDCIHLKTAWDNSYPDYLALKPKICELIKFIFRIHAFICNEFLHNV